MKIATKSKLKRKITNFFGALGYLSCTLQWLWVLVLYMSWLTAFITIISPNTSEPITQTPVMVSVGPTSPLEIIFGVMVFSAILALTAYVIYKMPSTIAKTGKKVIQATAKNVSPIVLKVQHKKETKKNILNLTPKIILFLKILLITTPIILAFISQFIEKQVIDFSIAVYASLCLAYTTVVFFSIQYSLSRLFLVDKQDIW